MCSVCATTTAADPNSRASSTKSGRCFLTTSSPCTGIYAKRDSLPSIAYSAELISATISATLQSTDRHHGIVVQKRSHFQLLHNGASLILDPRVLRDQYLDERRQ